MFLELLGLNNNQDEWVTEHFPKLFVALCLVTSVDELPNRNGFQINSAIFLRVKLLCGDRCLG